MDYGLEGRVALVTGAASGIGRATAELLAAMGARVLACDVNADAGAAVAAALREGGAEARFVAADVTDGEALRAVGGRRRVEAFGRLDCAANCAGVGGGHASTHEYPEDEWDRIVEVNLRGTWLAMRAEIEAMLARRGRGDRQRLLDARPARLAVRVALQREQARRPGPHADGGARVRGAGDPRQRGVPGRDRHADDGRDLRALPGFRETLTDFVPMGRMGGPARSPARSRG